MRDAICISKMSTGTGIHMLAETGQLREQMSNSSTDTVCSVQADHMLP